MEPNEERLIRLLLDPTATFGEATALADAEYQREAEIERLRRERLERQARQERQGGRALETAATR